eukprot:751422-Hanusia_phi.AAC.2
MSLASSAKTVTEREGQAQQHRGYPQHEQQNLSPACRMPWTVFPLTDMSMSPAANGVELRCKGESMTDLTWKCP